MVNLLNNDRNMASWLDKRKTFQDRYDKLTQENFQAIITELNKSVASYISKAGISQDSNNNPDFKRITDLINKAESIKQRFIQLNDDIINTIKENALNSNLSGMLAENGELQSHIKQLEKIKGEMKVDVDSAIARDALLRSKKTDISRHNLFLLDRPVRKGLIPYFWVISILFIGVGLVIFKMTMPVVAVGAAGIASTQGSLMGSIAGFFMDKRILISLLIAALIVIIFLALKVAGVFGKRN
jgi:hypothetical protein